MDGSLSPQWATAEPTLQIPSVSFEDEGTYECEAENSKGRDSVQGRIIVQGTGQDTLSPPSPSSLPEDVLPKVLPLPEPSGSRIGWVWERKTPALWPAQSVSRCRRDHTEGSRMI